MAAKAPAREGGRLRFDEAGAFFLGLVFWAFAHLEFSRLPVALFFSAWPASFLYGAEFARLAGALCLASLLGHFCWAALLGVLAAWRDYMPLWSETRPLWRNSGRLDMTALIFDGFWAENRVGLGFFRMAETRSGSRPGSRSRWKALKPRSSQPTIFAGDGPWRMAFGEGLSGWSEQGGVR